jgi:hypothetical protein
MRSTGTFASLLAAGLMTALLFTACGGDDEDIPTPAAPKSAANTSEAPAPIQPAPPVTPDELPPPITDLEEQFGEKLELPAYFPQDAPIWPGLNPADARKGENGRATAVWGVPDSGENVLAFVQQSMAEQGWTVILDQPLEVGHMLQATKGDRQLNVVTSPLRDTGKTVLAVSVSVE